MSPRRKRPRRWLISATKLIGPFLLQIRYIFVVFCSVPRQANIFLCTHMTHEMESHYLIRLLLPQLTKQSYELPRSGNAANQLSFVHKDFYIFNTEVRPGQRGINMAKTQGKKEGSQLPGHTYLLIRGPITRALIPINQSVCLCNFPIS